MPWREHSAKDFNVQNLGAMAKLDHLPPNEAPFWFYIQNVCGFVIEATPGKKKLQKNMADHTRGENKK